MTALPAPFSAAKPFLDDDFLLENDLAAALFHEHAARLPIIDYHNHLPPQDIAADRVFENLTEIWLLGDHYKWRAMRANGIPERFITGAASDWEKFEKWAETVPATLRNPLFHWTHLELRRFFGIEKLLSPSTAREVWEAANAQLPALAPQKIFEKMRVEALCTTDDPADDLRFHPCPPSPLKEEQIMGAVVANLSKSTQCAPPSGGRGATKMLPTFRPDKAILLENPTFPAYLEQLGERAGVSIGSLAELFAALARRLDFFENRGCRLSDHGLEKLPAADFTEKRADAILQARLSGKEISPDEAEIFHAAVLHYLCAEYARRGWAQQFHLGALRNNSRRLLAAVGADAGSDSIGDFPQARAMARFFDRLDQNGALAKTIVYNLNPADNAVFAAMAGNFNDGSMPGKIQWGSAWWFLDQKDGMEKQLNTLSNFGLLARFVGMLTDSRSFLSFPRHEYFRRILCNLLGRDAARGELPADVDLLGKLVRDVCYFNAKHYFNF